MTFAPLATPRSIDVALTGRCNLACHYCFYADEMTARTDLTTAEWLSAFDQFERLGVMDVCLSGGEAFTRPDFFELVDGLVGRKMRYSVLTNGTLVTEKLLDQFDTGKRRIRLNSVQVSIDGPTAPVHDLARPGSFDRAVRGLRLLKDRGFPVTVRVTIARHNLLEIESLSEFLLEKIGLASISTNDAYPVGGSGCNGTDDVVLEPRERKEAMEAWRRVARRWPGRVEAQAGAIACDAMYAEMEEARRTGVKTTRWGMGSLTACGCVFDRIAVLHDGGIVPCVVLARLVLGNLRKDDLVDVWRHHPVLASLRGRRSIPMARVAGCSDCEWNPYCNGSCPGLAFERTGDLNQANRLDCYRQFLEGTRPAETARA